MGRRRYRGSRGLGGDFPARPASELTRQGLLYKHRRLGPEGASRAYHEEMSKLRLGG